MESFYSQVQYYLVTYINRNTINDDDDDDYDDATISLYSNKSLLFKHFILKLE